MRPEDALAPDSTLGRYQIRRLIGSGGMGAVYEAVHRDLKKRVAIKVLSGELTRNAQAQQRFLREGEAASRIQHPHVVDVTDVAVDGGVSYLVMEYLEGEDLSRRLAREGALPVHDAIDLLLPVCAGLAVAHDEGVIHRDLKPENIFLARLRHGGVEPKILDFGVSKVTGPEAMALTHSAATLGTPHYMPPEQVGGAREADRRSDVYSLGVVLYECVTGQRPFDGESLFSILHAIATGKFDSPRSIRPELSLEIEAVIVRAMRLEPAERFDSVRDLAAALLPFAGEKSRIVWEATFQRRNVDAAGSDPASIGPQSGRTTLGSATGQQLTTLPQRRARMLAIGGAAAAGLLVLLGLFLLRPAPRGAEPAPRPSAIVVPQPTPAPAAKPAPAPPPTYRVEVGADPADAIFELDGVPAGTGNLRLDLPRDGRSHRLVVRAAGHQAADVTFIDAPPAPRMTLSPLPATNSRAAAPRTQRRSSKQPAATSTPAPETPSKKRRSGRGLNRSATSYARRAASRPAAS